MNTAASKRIRRHPQERRRQILDEAILLLGQRGYYGFGIRELAQRCGLTDPGLLHYFGSKEKLLIAVLEDWDRCNAEAVRSAAGVAREGNSEPKLTLAQVRELFHATAVRNSQQAEFVRLYAVLQAEALNETHPAYDYFREREAAAVANFATSVAPFVAEPRSTALQLFALMKGLEQEWLRTDGGFDLVAEWDRAAAKLLPTATDDAPA